MVYRKPYLDARPTEQVRLDCKRTQSLSPE